MVDFTLSPPASSNVPWTPPPTIIVPVGLLQADNTGWNPDGNPLYTVVIHNVAYGSIITSTARLLVAHAADQVYVGAYVRSGVNAGAGVGIRWDLNGDAIIQATSPGGVATNISAQLTGVVVNNGDTLGCKVDSSAGGGIATITGTINGTPMSFTGGNTTGIYIGEPTLAAGFAMDGGNTDATVMNQFTGTGVLSVSSSARQQTNGTQPTILTALPSASTYANCLIQRSTDNTLWYSDGTNWFHVSVDSNLKSDTIAASAAINTTETYISTPLAIAANQLKVGDHFRITAYGTCTSSVAKTSTFTPRLGSSGVVADTALSTITATSSGSGTNIPFEVQIDIIVRAIGSSGSVFVCGQLANNGVTGISTTAGVIGVGSAVTINTTGALKLGLSYKSSGTQTTCTFQSVQVVQVK